jgi:hypothetical protein
MKEESYYLTVLKKAQKNSKRKQKFIKRFTTKYSRIQKTLRR